MNYSVTISEVQDNACVSGQFVCSLLDLVAAVGSSVADDELQLLAGVLHKLSFKGSLLGLGGPGNPLINIEEPVQAHQQGDQTPANRLPNLQTGKHSFSHCSTEPPNSAWKEELQVEGC